MKPTLLNTILTLAALGTGTGLLLGGCATTSGYKQADKTGEGIAQYRDEVVNVKKAVDGTLKSMDQVEVTADTNPRKAFERFAKSVTDAGRGGGQSRTSAARR